MLIGVLEYMGINSTSVDPYSEILLKINQLLKPNGILLLAIENRLVLNIGVVQQKIIPVFHLTVLAVINKIAIQPDTTSQG